MTARELSRLGICCPQTLLHTHWGLCITSGKERWWRSKQSQNHKTRKPMGSLYRCSNWDPGRTMVLPGPQHGREPQWLPKSQVRAVPRPLTSLDKGNTWWVDASNNYVNISAEAYGDSSITTIIYWGPSGYLASLIFNFHNSPEIRKLNLRIRPRVTDPEWHKCILNPVCFQLPAWLYCVA